MMVRQPVAHRQLINCLLAEERLAETEKALHRLRDLEPGEPDVAIRLAMLALGDSRTVEARQLLSEVLATNPSQSEALELVALLSQSLQPSRRDAVCDSLRVLTRQSEGRDLTTLITLCPGQ